MTLYKAMSAVKRRELEAEIERLRNLGFDSVDREEKLREQLERQSKALTEAYAAIEAYKGKPVMLHRDMEELARLRVEVGQLHVKNEQLYRDRYDALSVHTKEGMLASEWLLRTGKAERRVKELEAENAELRERCKAIASDADNWKRLACTSDKDLNRPVEMDAAEREHYERGKDITGCDV